jgi:hypothetical protein
LISVLTDVTHSEVSEHRDLFGRERLGDDDQADRAMSAARCRLGSMDPFARGCETGGDLLPPRL